MTIQKLVIATKNQGKLGEFKELLKDLDIKILGLDDVGVYHEVHEDGKTYAENARKKAYEYFLETGVPTLAEDFGVEIKGLEWKPGVHSNRFFQGSEKNRNQKILELLEGKRGEHRKAKFVCAVALALSKNNIIVHEAEVEGLITTQELGDARAGVGYDSIFYHIDSGKTYSQMDIKEKSKHSHRAKAVDGIMPIIRKKLVEEKEEGR